MTDPTPRGPEPAKGVGVWSGVVLGVLPLVRPVVTVRNTPSFLTGTMGMWFSVGGNITVEVVLA